LKAFARTKSMIDTLTNTKLTKKAEIILYKE